MMQSNSVIVRNAKKDDIEEIARIALNNCKNPWTKKQLLEELEYDFAVLLCIEKDSRILGFCSAHITVPEVHLNEIAIKEKYRREYMGSMLLRYSIEEAKRRNCLFMTLEVRENNLAAIAFYMKNGFSSIGIRKDFYSNPKENAIVMRKEI